jgi:glutathione-independent formaldehyde dehydrogenase
MAGNRAVTFVGPHKMEVQDKGYPKMVDPKGRTIEHAVILKLVATNIGGSDLHIYNGRFAAPPGMQMGHENMGEVVEVGSQVQYLKKGRSVFDPVQCGMRYLPQLQGAPHGCLPARQRRVGILRRLWLQSGWLAGWAG